MSTQKQAAPHPTRRSLRRRQQSGRAKNLEASKVLPRIADGGNTWGMLFSFITTMSCKPSRRNRRDFCNFSLLRRVPRHDEAIAYHPGKCRSTNDKDPRQDRHAKSELVIPNSFVIRHTTFVIACNLRF